MDLHVMSFNLRFDNPRDAENAWGYRKGEAAAAIKRMAPAVLGVQEATYPMIQALEEQLSEYEWLGVGREGGLKGEFSAIFYQPRLLQPVSAGHFWLSPTPDVPGTKYPGAGCTRMCSWAQFRKRGGDEEFFFYNTHTDHALEEARTYGGRLIRDHIADQQKRLPLAAIVVGDLNATPSTEPIQVLRHLPDGTEFLHDTAYWLRNQGVPIGATFHGYKGKVDGEPIDYILYTDGWDVTEFSVFRETINGRYVSDHYPILAKMTLL